MSSIELTLINFLESVWETVIAETGKKECSEYGRLLGTKAKELLESQGNSTHLEIFKLHSGIYSMYLDLENPDQPFKPAMVWGNSRSMILDDITEFELRVLEEIAPTIKTPKQKPVSATFCG